MDVDVLPMIGIIFESISFIVLYQERIINNSNRLFKMIL